MNIGAHLSLGVKPRLSLGEAHAQGATCAQIFVSSPGAWKPPALSEEKLLALREARELGIAPILIHAIYLINLASADPVLVQRSRSSLLATLRTGAEFGANCVTTHLGSHAGRGHDAVAEQVAEGLLDVVERSPEGIYLALENSAGTGGILGAGLDELADLIARAGEHPRLKVTLDTAHLCGAGWDLAADGSAERLVEAIDTSFGLERLVAVHANDSKAAVGSRRDRHACIGEGAIGLDGFRALLRQTELRAVPWVLETPDLDTTLPAEERWRSLRALRALVEESG